MTNIYLKYATLTAGVESWSESVNFNALRFYEKPYAERTSNEMLNGEMTSHVKSSRTVWELTISANELVDTAKASFIEALYVAGGPWKFSLDNWTSEEIVIIDNSGEIPYEFLNNHKQLKQIELKLIQKSGD